MAENSFDLTVIKNLRKRRGLTAEEMARQAKLTRSTVAKIESGKANPTLSTVGAIADVLGLTATELLALSEARQTVQAEPQAFEDGGIKGSQVLLPGVEVFYLEIEPGARAMFDPRLHDNTMEVCMVLSGDLELSVGGLVHKLRPGQAISFRALQEHTLHSPRGCRMVAIHHNSA